MQTQQNTFLLGSAVPQYNRALHTCHMTSATGMLVPIYPQHRRFHAHAFRFTA